MPSSLLSIFSLGNVTPINSLRAQPGRSMRNFLNREWTEALQSGKVDLIVLSWPQSQKNTLFSGNDDNGDLAVNKEVPKDSLTHCLRSRIISEMSISVFESLDCCLTI